MEPDIRIVLLDLGGVLLELRNTQETFGMAGDDADFHRRWLMSPSVRELECGRMPVDEFARSAVREFELPYDADEFMRRFEYWPATLFAPVTRLLATMKSQYTLALLSNTNPVHWNRPDIAGALEPLLDHAFLSYRTGKLKPDAEAFEDVLLHYGVDADQVIFLDDNPLNIDAASARGMHAYLTRGYNSLEDNLKSADII